MANFFGEMLQTGRAGRYPLHVSIVSDFLLDLRRVGLTCLLE